MCEHFDDLGVLLDAPAAFAHVRPELVDPTLAALLLVPVRDLLEGALLLTTSKQQDGVSLGLDDLSPLVVGLGLGLADISLELDVISPPSICLLYTSPSPRD